mmetsp:Transcript_95384/g.160237  ORF Transcript_95384/g.160237 Transcript_95384/m.160237 type:complete len:90 (+) Transcript_95384:425-694(+)
MHGSLICVSMQLTYSADVCHGPHILFFFSCACKCKGTHGGALHSTVGSYSRVHAESWSLGLVLPTGISAHSVYSLLNPLLALSQWLLPP